MLIRQARIEDLDFVADLFDQYRVFYGKPSDYESGKSFIQYRMKNGESIIFLALDADNHVPMGFVQLYPIFTSVSLKRQWLLNDLFVAGKYRREGVAIQLMDAAKQLAVETDASGILLETANDNQQAQKLYEKLGYEKDTAHYFYFLQNK